MAVLNHRYSMGLFFKAIPCVHRGNDCCVYSWDGFGTFYPKSADDDICDGNFHGETVWSWQMVKIEADYYETAQNSNPD